ncbi:hypothetical protein DIPPA_01074 [Diplonema papillatum]|nr:hypothetical protein DIPPA_01074 [Diplonema papillatum]|eukprot:gene6867-10534_t
MGCGAVKEASNAPDTRRHHYDSEEEEPRCTTAQVRKCSLRPENMAISENPATDQPPRGAESGADGIFERSHRAVEQDGVSRREPGDRRRKLREACLAFRAKVSLCWGGVNFENQTTCPMQTAQKRQHLESWVNQVGRSLPEIVPPPPVDVSHSHSPSSPGDVPVFLNHGALRKHRLLAKQARNSLPKTNEPHLFKPLDVRQLPISHGSEARRGYRYYAKQGERSPSITDMGPAIPSLPPLQMDRVFADGMSRNSSNTIIVAHLPVTSLSRVPPNAPQPPPFASRHPRKPSIAFSGASYEPS